MKKIYLTPETLLGPVFGTSRPLCASTESLTSLEESDDLSGLDWN